MRAAPETDRLLFESPSGIRVGRFRRYPWQVPFEDTGPTQGHLLVFPRVGVVIRHAGRAPVVADPTRVMLYNRGQEYTRRALTERGDACEWFAVPPEAIAAAMRDEDPAVDDRLDRPFTRTHAPALASTYLLQRRVTLHVAREPSPDRLYVEEAVLHLLHRAVGSRRPRRAPRASTARRHAEIVEACRALLNESLGEPLSLFEIAARLGVSGFHLARLFRAESGSTLHACRHELRLRAALERVSDGEDLSRIAADLGYASHSHFTATFRRAFGATPSAWRSTAHPPREAVVSGRSGPPVRRQRSKMS